MDDFAHARLAEDEPRNPFDLKVLVLYALARFKTQIVALGILGALLGLIAGAAQPNSYAVMSRLRLNESVRLGMRSDEAVYGAESGEPVRYRMSSAILEELELLKDPVILDRVVEVFGPRYILTVADPRAGDGAGTSMPVKFMHGLQAGLIHLKGLDDPVPEGEDTPDARLAAHDRLKANLTVGNQRNTNILNVKYTDSSPARAKKIGDEIVNQMRIRHREEFAAAGSLEKLQDNLDLALQEFQKTKRELLDYKEQCGFKDLPNDLLTTNEVINTLESDLALKQIALAAANSRVQSIERDLRITAGVDSGQGADDANTPENMRPNPERIKAQGLLTELETSLKGHELQFGANPTGVELTKRREWERQVAAQKRVLGETPRYVSNADIDEMTLLGEEFAEVKTLLLTERGIRDGLKSDVEGITEYLRNQRDRLRDMEECEVEYDSRASRFENARLKKERLQQQELFLAGLDDMDKEGGSNLTLFRGSILPTDKEGPQRSKPLLMGLIGGMLLGAGLSVLRQVLDRRVRYEETVENGLGLRVLCVVPDLSGKPGFQKKQGVA
ncbi:MAG: hypothetical protein AAFU73_07560 [Planctomycetota bacterium]